MQIISTNKLSEEQKRHVAALKETCFSFEQLENNPYLSNDLNIDKQKDCFFLLYQETELVSFLAAFLPSNKEVEFNGFTHPEFRNQGLFTSLVDRALACYQDMPFEQALFQREENSQSSLAYLQKRYPELDRTEYRFILSKTKWENNPQHKASKGRLVLTDETNKDTYVQITSAASLEDVAECAAIASNFLIAPNRAGYIFFVEDNPIGVFNVQFEQSGTAFLYGVGILPTLQNHGYGRDMLSLAFENLFSKVDEIGLEVDSKNPPALALYRKLGFETVFQVDYHRLILCSRNN